MKMSKLWKGFEGKMRRLNKQTIAGILVILAAVFFFTGGLQAGYIPASESGNIISPGDFEVVNGTDVILTWSYTDGPFSSSEYYGYTINMSFSSGEFVSVFEGEILNMSLDDVIYTVHTDDYETGDVLLIRIFFYTNVTTTANDGTEETTTVVYWDDAVIYIVEPEIETTTTTTPVIPRPPPPPPPPPSGPGMAEIISYGLIGGGVLIVSIVLYGQMKKRKAAVIL
jgi:hypothetical protein